MTVIDPWGAVVCHRFVAWPGTALCASCWTELGQRNGPGHPLHPSALDEGRALNVSRRVASGPTLAVPKRRAR